MQDIPLAFLWRDAKSSRIAVLALQLFTIDNCKPGREPYPPIHSTLTAFLLRITMPVPISLSITHPYHTMGKIYQEIDERIKKWIGLQKVFFVATAPLDPNGHINCSPKDGYSIRVLDNKTLVYLDLIGSGVETIAHIRENKRIIVMMCAFEGAPMIMRFHGIGEIIEKDNPDFEGLKPLFDSEIGIRSFIKVHLNRISDSCGFGVPVMEFKQHRKQLRTFNERNGEEKLADYKIQHNSLSIDRLPGVRTK